jgi:hypothetical protein
MAHKEFVAVLSMIAAAPALATSQEPVPASAVPNAQGEYCLRVAPVTGSLVETVQCWTREEWAEQGVDVDKEWPKEGVVLNG